MRWEEEALCSRASRVSRWGSGEEVAGGPRRAAARCERGEGAGEAEAAELRRVLVLRLLEVAAIIYLA